MNINKAFILRCVADENLLIPTGAAATHVQGLVTLNETGALLYRKLCDGCSVEALVDALTSEYDVSADEAHADIREFLEHMRQLGVVTED